MASVEQALEILSIDGAEKLNKIGALCRENYSMDRSQSVWDLLKHLGISEKDLNSLNIIHVAGSKGKGSTCTMIESILRANGIKTGLFTSPHVVKVNERICIGGKPISNEKFVEIFNKLWSGEGQNICREYNFSPYFLVFFCMAIRAFIDEGVEVAVIEVGRGGEYDVTNIITKPIVCAVTLLEVEHSDILGDNIESIAWHKSGIFKSGAKAFTIPQKDAAMVVLNERAEERKCDLKVTRKLSHFIEEWNQNIEIGLKGKFQHINASLAIEVCLTWMTKMGRIEAENKELKTWPKDVIRGITLGLKKAFIIARFQIIERPGMTFYIDLAHTIESMKSAANWFEECCSEKAAKVHGRMSKILIFGTAKDKDYGALISILQRYHYDKVVFPICHLVNEKDVTLKGLDMEKFHRDNLRAVEETWKLLDPSRNDSSYKQFENVNETVAWIAAGRDEKTYSKAVQPLGYSFQDKSAEQMDHLQVFVVASFALINGVLKLLDN